MKNINRLIIADPSFEDWVGHHAPYDISILKAGDQAGLKVQIWAAKVIDADISAYADGISKIYSCSAWGRPYEPTTPLQSRVATIYRSVLRFRPAPQAYFKTKAQTEKKFRFAIRTIKYFLRNLVPPIMKRMLLHPASCLADFIPPVVLDARRKLLEKIEISTGRRIKLLPALVLFTYKQLTPSFFKRLVLNPAAWVKDLLPPFATKLAQAIVSKISKSFPYITYRPLLGRSKLEYFETIRSVAKNKLGEGDVLFSHMITGCNFLAWAMIAKYCERKGIKTKILFRYPTSFLPEQRADIKIGRLLYEQCAKSGLVEYYSDSHVLADSYRGFLNAPVQTLPIPHLPVFVGSSEQVPDRKINVVVLGNARAEKGFCEIIESIKLLQDSGEQGLEFVIQTNNPDVDAAARMHELDEITGIKIKKCETALTEKEYEKILSGSDVVLAPYHSEVYGARTSGVLLEAISASKIAIVAENTWLATELEENGTGVVVKNKSTTSIAKALVYVRDNFLQLKTEASIKAKEYRRRHGAENFLKCMLGANKLLPLEPPRAVIVFPFSDFFEQSTGATVRTGLLCQYLLSEGVQVSVVLPQQNSSSPHVRLSGAIFYQYRENQPRTDGMRYFFKSQLRRRENYRAIWYTTRSQSNYKNTEFDRALNGALRQNSVVLVDYPFDIENIKRATRSYGNKISLTLHDLMGLFGKKGALRSRALEIELAAAATCDRVVTVAKHESDFLKSIGVNNELIPNPCVISGRSQGDGVDAPGELRIEGSFALFVGSNHLPNIDAAIALRSVAKKLSDAGSEVKIVVAGACLDAGIDEGFISLGKVSDESLRYLNENCMMFVCPLEGGTGASLKTIQAMGFGKVVLGTQDAFRGLDVASLINCIIEDELVDYPRWIMEVERIPGKFDSIRSRALEFSMGYDYRVVFRPQLEYIRQCVLSDGAASSR
jgi:glycosyltransferase involved in cell wall biosynthesis